MIVDHEALNVLYSAVYDTLEICARRMKLAVRVSSRGCDEEDTVRKNKVIVNAWSFWAGYLIFAVDAILRLSNHTKWKRTPHGAKIGFLLVSI